MPFGRRLGVDFGQTRVGIALCDSDGLISTPLTTLKNDGKLFSNLSIIIEENQITGIYLGKPVHLSGVEGATVELVAAFAQRLQESFDLPITYVDERLTSKEAERILKAAGKNAIESRALIDQVSAQAILQLGIDIEKNAKN